MRVNGWEWIVILGFLALAWFLPSYLIAKSAERKGRSFIGYLAIGLLASWIISLILNLVLPPVDTSPKKPCPKCAELINVAAVVCKHCGSQI